MKKSTLIIIAIIYVASIVVISMLGLKAIVYDAKIPVTGIEILNTDDRANGVEVEKEGDRIIISVRFTAPWNPETQSGTKLQINYRVHPDNATNSKVELIYRKDLENVQFITLEDGTWTGLIGFTDEETFTLEIRSTDGSRVSTKLTIVAYL